MRRYVPLLIAGMALIVSGCRDTVAPPHSAPLATLVPVQDMSFAQVVSSTEGANATEIKFMFSRAAGSTQLGDFTLTWQENSVCERDNSGYGPEFFRKPCQAENDDIEITARVWSDNDRTYVDFQPDIRFSPAKDVTLGIVREEIIGKRLSRKLMKKYNIFYTRRIGNTRFYLDEGWFDPKQRTRYDTETGLVSREIRHFSGFVIRTGTEDQAAHDALGVESSQ